MKLASLLARVHTQKFDVNTAYIYNGVVRFEWDDVKRIHNLDKHGVDFLDAPEIFNGPMLVRLDVRKDYREPRWQGVGAIRGRLMVVAYTKRDSSTIRIISLRKANSREKDLFQETLKDELDKN